MLKEVGEPLGLDMLDAAEAVLAVANNSMAGAIRTAALARGLDTAAAPQRAPRRLTGFAPRARR